MAQIEEYMNSKDYVRANTLIEESARDLEELNQKIVNTTTGTCSGFGDVPVLYLIGGAGVVGAIAILSYLFWPQKPETGYHPEKGWIPQKQKPAKVKKNEDFMYDFKRKRK